MPTPKRSPKKIERRERFVAFTTSEGALDELCDFIAEGGHLTLFCRQLDIPYTSVYKWLADDMARIGAYEMAMQARADSLADQIQEIADDATHDLMRDEDGNLLKDGYGNPIANRVGIERAKLRLDARKWTASKLNPKKYSEKHQQIHTGADGGAIDTNLTISFESPNDTN